MSLSSVLGEVGVHEMNEIISDWNRENTWHSNTIFDFSRVFVVVD
jgi:hypothetical protein